MRFYQDVMQAQEPRETLAAIGDLLRSGIASDEQTPRARSLRIDVLRDALVRAGMLEQSLADALPEHRLENDGAHQSRRLTHAVAHALVAAWEGQEQSPGRTLEPIGALSGVLDRRAVLPATAPEGYLFYGLFPESYWRLGQDLGRALAPATPVVVAGIRSIGTSLSAVLAEGLRQTGHPCLRITVRPSGTPFEREAIPTAAEVRRLRRAATRGAQAVAVDEGPGLSGSSLAAAVRALRACGFDQDRIVIACANAPAALPHATPETRRIWEATRWFAAQGYEKPWWRQHLPALLGDALAQRLDLEADISWGAWRAYRRGLEDTPLPMPDLERRKLLLRVGDTRVIAKFIGFGPAGARKAQIARDLAMAGYTPHVLGFAHGMLLQRWLPDALPCDEPPIAAAAGFYAHLRQHCRTGGAITLQEAIQPATEIVRAWFGDRFDRTLAALATAAGRILVQQIDGDGKPERTEWLMDVDAVRKADAGDHFLDHSWARSQDSCFDLAGFSQEFTLAPAQEGALLQHYIQQSGDAEAAMRLPFYHLLYAAHRLAGLDTAYHAAGATPPPHVDALRRRYAQTLERRLLECENPCAS